MSTPTRPYRGVSARERAAGRRTRLLEAGLELLGTAGGERTTMTAVCARAKLTERYFYESFRNREDLLIAVVDHVAGELRHTVLTALEEADGDAGTKGRAAIAAFVHRIDEDPRLGRAGLVESAAVAVLRPRRHQLLRTFADLVVAQAELLYGAEALPEPRDRVHALLFVGGLAELLTAWLTGELTVTAEEIVDAATHQFVTSMHV
ncbi:TetR/AcrR family transcriptional regulator [Amycolatopsis mongoliensis]|uniref:TetR/AcrR family transcriptional regulator n=1 Tax=Amycolatopsis mongoliensis TaxID=715475 RepID=A0A9Y2JHE0_9PSEU|nr:TetR/AcrR family transcriptional regulator [Amycolatopsis sp. 4-36]WIX98549.1 TetR/AcrR family transcriptional regulator [Amycolatopsis sp. 4-36]